MKFPSALSDLPLEFVIPAVLVIASAVYLYYRIQQIRIKHMSTKKLDAKTIINLIFNKNRRNTNWEEFKHGTGRFSDNNNIHKSFGGGVSGSW